MHNFCTLKCNKISCKSNLTQFTSISFPSNICKNFHLQILYNLLPLKYENIFSRVFPFFSLSSNYFDFCYFLISPKCASQTHFNHFKHFTILGKQREIVFLLFILPFTFVYIYFVSFPSDTQSSQVWQYSRKNILHKNV